MTRRADRPSSRTEDSRAELAHAAVALGHAALATGDIENALRWLDRAHRLVPADPNVKLTLASACLDCDPGKAARLFQDVADQHDIRHAWFGVAAARLRQAGPAAAAEALATALSRHIFVSDIQALGTQIAVPPIAPGWCGLSSDGKVVVGAASSTATHVEIRLDGRVVANQHLPRGWQRHARLDVSIEGTPALGSPILIDRMTRVAGCVEAVDGGLAGWAWHPADPDRPVTLTLRCDKSHRTHVIQATTESGEVPHAGPLARPRAFAVSRSELAWARGPIHVTGADGRDLLGSPIDPSAEGTWHAEAATVLAMRYPAAGPRASRKKTRLHAPVFVPLRVDAPVPCAPIGADRRRRGVTVVIPVHNGGRIAIECLDSVLAGTGKDARIIVVDDGSTQEDVVAALDALAADKSIRLIRHRTALGFPASANAGIAAAAGRDVVLLNSDTLVPSGWLERLREAAYRAADIGTVTPFSNDATILSYPHRDGDNPPPDQASVDRIDAAARKANADQIVDLPVGVGFCLYLRRDCLTATGSLRPDIFAQGYGEENDFCLRARRLGWRHVALTGLFVGHHGSISFDPMALHLRRRNARLLDRLHPGYDALVTRFLSRDPLADARRRLDEVRWRAANRRGQSAVILVTHDHGGGVEQRVIAAIRDCQAYGQRAIVLRPAVRSDGETAVTVHDGLAHDYPNLVYALPRELPALRHLLRGTRVIRAEVHHLLDHHVGSIERFLAGLTAPYDVHIHDYAWFCPRLSLLGQQDRYCGEPELPDCASCIADLGHYMNEDLSVEALRARSAAFFAAARTVIAPSEDTATRMRRHFPTLSPTVVPHENDEATPFPPTRRRAGRSNGRIRICVVGGIGKHKGYDVLLACARDAARRSLPLEFVLVGHSIDDARLLATERVFITGPFRPEEIVALIRAQHADLGFVPSVWPETWCLSLGDIWRAGLPAVAFDLGAPAERIRRTGRGFVLPFGLISSSINKALLAAAGADH
ncbi:glycosyltransferase [Rhodopila sp.]|uniref:glycosyltransferase n=1 Tax=Rhodopila sp. TaxID=2480087 RepID=UPI002C39D7B5|nr:glycosyltransferase [Rhodopila sp.]HVZ10485.1 glycosyltransferase [Rhodopila sp.]